jgi:uncharacterized protein involved in exopolysaccharide biosynthesis
MMVSEEMKNNSRISADRFNVDEDEIDLLEYWRIIWKRKIMISILTFIIVITAAVGSLFMTDIYEARAVITPVSSTQGSASSLSSLASQFGGIASLAGISCWFLVYEIINYLNSKALREKVIVKYDLLPLLLSDKWDKEKKAWRGPGLIEKALNVLRSSIKAIKPEKTQKGEGVDDSVPTVWDGLRMLQEEVLVITSDDKNNAITISVNIDDPQNAAKIASYFVTSLTDHMSGESKRVAEANKKHLEEQLAKAADPIIRQKIYTLLSQQVETSLMSEVKENFAFKVIDPPKAPDKKIKPRRGLIVALSFVMSIFIGVMLAFILDIIGRNRANLQGASAGK